MTDWYKQIASGLLEPVLEPREEAANRFRQALAELKEDPRWRVLEERTVARLASIVRDLIDKAGDVQRASYLAGQAACLLEMLESPQRAIRAIQEKNDEEQGQEDL